MKPESQMEPHERRVVQELSELTSRYEKLKLFINASTTFEALPALEKDRLHRQLGIMGAYMDVLRERIANFPAGFAPKVAQAGL